MGADVTLTYMLMWQNFDDWTWWRCLWYADENHAALRFENITFWPICLLISVSSISASLVWTQTCRSCFVFSASSVQKGFSRHFVSVTMFWFLYSFLCWRKRVWVFSFGILIKRLSELCSSWFLGKNLILILSNLWFVAISQDLSTAFFLH